MMVGLFLTMLLAFVVPAAASAISAVFTAKRCHDIPLYWIVGMASSVGFTVAAIQLEVRPSVFEGVESELDHFTSIATSWPNMACVLGAIVATRLSKLNSQWMKALSGASWGLLSMSICRLALTA